MQSTSAATSIPVPEIDSAEPVAVIPVASVAPLDGAPDGERINTFALAPKGRSRFETSGTSLRERVIDKPLTAIGAAFALGVILGRALL